MAKGNLPGLPTAPVHVSHWYVRVNLFGALAYVVLVGWLLWGSVTSLVIEIDDDGLDWYPLIGIVVAVVGLIAIYFGAEHDPGT